MRIDYLDEVAAADALERRAKWKIAAPSPVHTTKVQHGKRTREGVDACGLFYRRLSCRSFSSTAARKIIPSNSPVFVKRAGGLEALRNTATRVAVVSEVAGRARETPRSTRNLIVHGEIGMHSGEIYTTRPAHHRDV